MYEVNESFRRLDCSMLPMDRNYLRGKLMVRTQKDKCKAKALEKRENKMIVQGNEWIIRKHNYNAGDILLIV